MTSAATSRLKAIRLDCRNPAESAPFRAEVLGYVARPYGPDDLEHLASIGRTATTDPAVALDPQS